MSAPNKRLKFTLSTYAHSQVVHQFQPAHTNVACGLESLKLAATARGTFWIAGIFWEKNVLYFGAFYNLLRIMHL